MQRSCRGGLLGLLRHDYRVMLKCYIELGQLQIREEHFFPYNRLLGS